MTLQRHPNMSGMKVELPQLHQIHQHQQQHEPISPAASPPSSPLASPPPPSEFTPNHHHHQNNNNNNTKHQQQETSTNSRAPKCTRCRNHGIISDLRGHKHKCFWRDCTCTKCLISSDRQRATADRIALFRQQVRMIAINDQRQRRHNSNSGLSKKRKLTDAADSERDVDRKSPSDKPTSFKMSPASPTSYGKNQLVFICQFIHYLFSYFRSNLLNYKCEF